MVRLANPGQAAGDMLRLILDDDQLHVHRGHVADAAVLVGERDLAGAVAIEIGEVEDMGLEAGGVVPGSCRSSIDSETNEQVRTAILCTPVLVRSGPKGERGWFGGRFDKLPIVVFGGAPFFEPPHAAAN